MITHAAVKILLFDAWHNAKHITIPCHRHCDAFQILKDFGYTKEDYQEIAQGFLDDNGAFLTRSEAYEEAKRCNQFLDSYENDSNCSTVLYSEDIW